MSGYPSRPSASSHRYVGWPRTSSRHKWSISEGTDQKLTGLPKATATAARLRDSKNDDEAAKVLDVALARYSGAPPLDCARAARADLAVASGETEKLAAVRGELRSVPLSDAGRAAHRRELQAADELEQTQR